jgi:hypothetical protein
MVSSVFLPFCCPGAFEAIKEVLGISLLFQFVVHMENRGQNMLTMEASGKN